MSLIGPPFIMTARHHMPGVRSEQDYLHQQTLFIRQLRTRLPNLPISDPWLHVGNPNVYISNGYYQIPCECGNWPAVEFEWGGGMALCYECGAMYRGLEPPEHREAIEAELIKRPMLTQRWWKPGMTMDEVQRITQEILAPPIIITPPDPNIVADEVHDDIEGEQ